MNKPFLLVGEDFEGDSREIGFHSLRSAIEAAITLSITNESGPGWKSWAIWGNDPQTEEWRSLEVSQ